MGQLTLPPKICSALHVTEGDEVEFAVTEDGQVLLRGLAKVATDQRWFWDQQWQAGEREASERIAAGQVRTFGDADGMFGALGQ
jgi:bifunctional DNA-binding transcriptional regulator/antitoxin component of YhaV-PrlF toxin-antitoxin module